jgi:hypothetical protein
MSFQSQISVGLTKLENGWMTQTAFGPISGSVLKTAHKEEFWARFYDDMGKFEHGPFASQEDADADIVATLTPKAVA